VTQSHTFEADRRAIRYADEGAGPTVVLLPGRGLDIAYLGTLAHVLDEEGFRVVRIGSRRPSSESAVTMHDLAQDVVDVMDHLALDHAWIGGHGFGGAVARAVALDHTDRVDGVLLLAVEGAEPQPDEPLTGLSRDAQVAAAQTAALAATPEPEWASLAPNVPVLIIQGTDDRVTVPANGERLQATAPHLVSLSTVEGGGHLFVSTHAGETGFLIEDYLGMD